MAIIVRSAKVNPKNPATFWVEQCIEAGTKDEHGNNFRIIKLFWKSSANHKMAPYVKTKGFEDAEISMNGQGFNVRYHRNGSLWWQQPVTGVGPYFAECALTTYNLKKLASCYGDGLWTFSNNDRDIEQVVKDMYDKKVVNLPAKMKEFNEKRIKGMHVHIHDDIKVENTITPEIVDALESIEEQKRQNFIEAEKLRKKEAELQYKEESIVKATREVAAQGALIAPYSEKFLRDQKLNELRKIAKLITAPYSNDMNKESIIAVIMKLQNGSDEIQEPSSRQDEESLED